MLENVDLTAISIKPFSNSNGNSKRNSREESILLDIKSQEVKAQNQMGTSDIEKNHAAHELKKYEGNCHCGQFKFSVQVPEFKSVSECECSACAMVCFYLSLSFILSELHVN